MNKLKAPKPVGPYSVFRHLSRNGGWVTAGQIPIDPNSDPVKLNNATIEDEIVQVFDNIEAVLSNNNKDLNDVKKFTVFVTDLSYTPLINSEIEKRIKNEYPSRSTIQVSALPMGARVEIECLG